MRWFISRREHIARFTELSRTYRGELESLRRRCDAAERAVASLVRVHTHRPFPEPRMCVVLDFPDRMLREQMPHELYQRIAECVVETLVGADKDYRPDARDPDPDRVRLLR